MNKPWFEPLVHPSVYSYLSVFKVVYQYYKQIYIKTKQNKKNTVYFNIQQKPYTAANIYNILPVFLPTKWVWHFHVNGIIFLINKYRWGPPSGTCVGTHSLRPIPGFLGKILRFLFEAVWMLFFHPILNTYTYFIIQNGAQVQNIHWWYKNVISIKYKILYKIWKFWDSLQIHCLLTVKFQTLPSAPNICFYYVCVCLCHWAVFITLVVGCRLTLTSAANIINKLIRWLVFCTFCFSHYKLLVNDS